MSTRIRLFISQQPAQDDPSVTVTRLLCRVVLSQGNGQFTLPRYAIVDTGAPTSLIPNTMWQPCPVLKLKDAVIHGIIDRPECDLAAVDGVIGCVLQDDQTNSELLTIRAHLAPTDDVPLLLGFSGLLEQATIYFSIAEQKAYLEI